MKKLLMLFVFLPVVAFGSFDYGDFRLVAADVYRYTSYDVWPGRTYVPHYQNINSLDQLKSIFSSSTFGFKIQLRRTTTSGYDFTLKAPSSSASSLVIVSSVTSLTNSLYCSTNGVSVKVSPLAFPPLASLYQTSATLFALGYRGPAVEWFEGPSSNFCVNVDYPLLLSDVLSSTNTVFRRILLSSLNSIQSNVSTLVDLFNDEIIPGFSYTTDHLFEIKNINNSILTNSQSSSSSLRSIDQDMDILIDRVGDVLDKVSSDPFVNDFTNAVNALLSSGKISPVQASSFLSSYSSLSSPTAKAVFALSLKENINASQFAKDFISTAASPDLSDELIVIGQSFGADVVDALIGDYPDVPTRGRKSVNTRTSIKSQLSSWREEAKKQLQDWKDDLRQQLQDWKTSDESGYLNVRGGIDNVASNQYRYFDRNSPDSAVNYGVQILTNASNQFSRDLSSAFANITNALDNISDKVSSGELGVKITYPLRYHTTEEVNVHDQEVVDSIRNGYINIQELKSAILEALNTSDPSVRIKGTNHVDLSEWIDEWRRWVDNATFYDLAYSLEDFMTNALPLFSDYKSTYKLPDNFYKKAFDTIRNSSHTNVLARLCFYGLSSQPEEGNFFDFYTSAALLQSELVSTFLDAKDMIDDLSSSSSWFDGLSVFSAARKVSDSIPSRSQLEQMVSTASDGTNLVLSSSTDLLNSFGLMTNLHTHAFSVFKTSSTSLPDHIVLFRFKTSSGVSGSSFRDVSIPVGTVPNLWLVIRLSIAFGICAVNLILFPKFLLKLALLFMPLFKKSLPFLNASK